MFSGSRWWCDTAWCASGTPIHGYVRPLSSREIWNATDAGDVGLEREDLQVEHQPGVLVVLVRDADRLLDRRRSPRSASAVLGPLDALFDVADGGRGIRPPSTGRRRRAAARSRAMSSTANRGCCGPVASARTAPPPCRRRRTSARTRRADRSPSAAAWSASATRRRAQVRRSCSRSRSCRPGSCSRAPAPASAAACRGRDLRRPSGRSSCPRSMSAPSVRFGRTPLSHAA